MHKWHNKNYNCVILMCVFIWIVWVYVCVCLFWVSMCVFIWIMRVRVYFFFGCLSNVRKQECSAGECLQS